MLEDSIGSTAAVDPLAQFTLGEAPHKRENKKRRDTRRSMKSYSNPIHATPRMLSYVYNGQHCLVSCLASVSTKLPPLLRLRLRARSAP